MTPDTQPTPAPSAADNNAPTPELPWFWAETMELPCGDGPCKTLKCVSLEDAQAALAAKDREIAELADQLRIVVDAESFRARKIERERDSYKARAEKAEAELADLRHQHASVFRMLGIPENDFGELENFFIRAADTRAERDALRAKVENQAERIRYLEGATNHATGTPLSHAIRERDQLRAALAAAKATLDWAETLLCNAKPLSHCTQDEWDELVHKWRDQKHAARKA